MGRIQVSEEGMKYWRKLKGMLQHRNSDSNMTNDKTLEKAYNELEEADNQ